MKINCSQFEGLITFYIDKELSNALNTAFEEHMKECSTCAMKFKIIKSIVEDIKTAYNKILDENGYKEDVSEITDDYINNEEINNIDLSAYIDNELSDENNVKVRRNIIAKPKVRNKIEKMYKLRKILSGSFAEHKNTLKTDFSKDIIKSINSDFTAKEVCIHCFLFIVFVLMALVLSIWTVIHIL